MNVFAKFAKINIRNISVRYEEINVCEKQIFWSLLKLINTKTSQINRYLV